MNFKNFIKVFAEKSKNIIAYLEGFTELSGEAKKKKLDDEMVRWAEHLLEGAKISLITKFIIRKFVINAIPVITQAIFDLIKAKVKGITEG